MVTWTWSHTSTNDRFIANFTTKNSEGNFNQHLPIYTCFTILKWYTRTRTVVAAPIATTPFNFSNWLLLDMCEVFSPLVLLLFAVSNLSCTTIVLWWFVLHYNCIVGWLHSDFAHDTFIYSILDSKHLTSIYIWCWIAILMYNEGSTNNRGRDNNWWDAREIATISISVSQLNFEPTPSWELVLKRRLFCFDGGSGNRRHSIDLVHDEVRHVGCNSVNHCENGDDSLSGGQL